MCVFEIEIYADRLFDVCVYQREREKWGMGDRVRVDFTQTCPPSTKFKEGGVDLKQ